MAWVQRAVDACDPQAQHYRNLAVSACSDALNAREQFADVAHDRDGWRRIAFAAIGGCALLVVLVGVTYASIIWGR
jgi:hypothetical protein